MSKPHCDSLYRKLQRAKKLDGLMHFLEDPSSPNPGTYPRCSKAVPLLASWGFPHCQATIWRLYRDHVLFWRIEAARSAVKSSEALSNFDEEISKTTVQRTFELLTQPNLDPNVLINLARIEFQKDTLRLNKEKFKTTLRTKLETALDALSQEIKNNPKARAAFSALQEAIEK